MSRDKNEKRKKRILILILFSITFSFTISFYLCKPDFSLIGKSEREKLIDILPEYYGLLFFSFDIMEPGSTVLILEQQFYYYAQALYYPIIYCDFLSYHPGTTTDQEVLNYIKNREGIKYLMIFYIDFPFSTNTTYFLKDQMDSTSYLLEINRTAL